MIKRCRAAPYEWEGKRARRMCACLPRGGGGVLEDDREQKRRARKRRSEEELYHLVADWQWKWWWGGTLQRNEALFSCAGTESGLSDLMEPQ